MTLGFSKPPPDITEKQLFDKMKSKVQDILSTAPKGYPYHSLLKVSLTDDQWCQIHQLLAELAKDYRLRREMLLTRLDVTVLSFTVCFYCAYLKYFSAVKIPFQWSPNVKTKLDAVTAIYQPLRSDMSVEPNVTIAHLLSAR